ncbi:hypothetical protein SCORR_v1c10360 (plasmid) [Spiroplasma corruscae]|uniref:Uncharacterized protein n=1 Tax=Spiroplasma corruscae TaxID=216934 RepID=A0A222EQJ8_9MOLU|nr:hypothetical protein [Spiroplasma corruscae]ASP28808.1 hypothetical protein SCORR_v1c10360 [Spiroplasma corruscae]
MKNNEIDYFDRLLNNVSDNLKKSIKIEEVDNFKNNLEKFNELKVYAKYNYMNYDEFRANNDTRNLVTELVKKIQKYDKKVKKVINESYESFIEKEFQKLPKMSDVEWKKKGEENYINLINDINEEIELINISKKKLMEIKYQKMVEKYEKTLKEKEILIKDKETADKDKETADKDKEAKVKDKETEAKEKEILIKKNKNYKEKLSTLKVDKERSIEDIKKNKNLSKEQKEEVINIIKRVKKDER